MEDKAQAVPEVSPLQIPNLLFAKLVPFLFTMEVCGYSPFIHSNPASHPHLLSKCFTGIATLWLPFARVALGVFVVETGAQSLQCSSAAEILGLGGREETMQWHHMCIWKRVRNSQLSCATYTSSSLNDSKQGTFHLKYPLRLLTYTGERRGKKDGKCQTNYSSYPNALHTKHTKDHIYGFYST